jgi:hypothetical protein
MLSACEVAVHTLSNVEAQTVKRSSKNNAPRVCVCSCTLSLGVLRRCKS